MFVVFLWLCVGLIDLPNPMDLCPCTNFFLCLRSYKDRAFSATSAKLEEKKKTVKGVLADLELRVIGCFSERLVALLMPARHVLVTPLLLDVTQGLRFKDL